MYNWASVSEPHTSVFNFEFCLYVRLSVHLSIRSITYRILFAYPIQRLSLPMPGRSGFSDADRGELLHLQAADKSHHGGRKGSGLELGKLDLLVTTYHWLTSLTLAPQSSAFTYVVYFCNTCLRWNTNLLLALELTSAILVLNLHAANTYCRPNESTAWVAVNLSLES